MLQNRGEYYHIYIFISGITLDYRYRLYRSVSEKLKNKRIFPYIYIYIIIIYSIVIYRLSHYIERDSFDNDGKIFYAKTSDFSIAGISDRRET